MKNKSKANLVALLHIVLILFGIISLPLLFVITYWHKVVLGFIILIILSWVIFRGCLLNQLENKWRSTEIFNEEGFIQHYMKKFLNINCSRRATRILTYSYMAALLCIALIQFLFSNPL